MPIASIELPHDLESLRALALRQQAQLQARDAQILLLEEYLRLLKHYRFGRTSEQVPDGQIALFNEAEAAMEAAEREESEGVAVSAHTRAPRGRRPLPAWIPRVEIVHDLPEAEKVCANDGTKLTRIGEEILEQLEWIPAKVRVLRHVRPKYACPSCHEGVHVAPPPAQPIPKSLASPALLAHVATSKYADGLPLYRLESVLARAGIELPRSTLSHWMIRCGELVQPLCNLMREELLATGLVQCDETRFPVLKEPGKAPTSHAYLWTLRAPERPLVSYEYDPSRSGQVPLRLLEGFQGVLQTDGYEGYGAVGALPGIVHVGCWAHARRKFVEALEAQGGKKKPPAKDSIAGQGLDFLQKLYALERKTQGASAQERTQHRQQHAKPLLEQLRKWLDLSRPKVPPQSLTGKALAYLAGQWPKLERVLDDGRIPLDTNLVENAIRPFVVGRKGWLFADTVRGAQASANLYSLVETAKAHELEPFAYLRQIFAELPRATTLEQVEALLPRRIDRELLQDPRQNASSE